MCMIFDRLNIIFLKVISSNVFYSMEIGFHLLFIIKPSIYKDGVTSIFIRNNHFFSAVWEITKYNINSLCRQYLHVPFVSKLVPCCVMPANLLRTFLAGHQIMLVVLCFQIFLVPFQLSHH